MPQISQLCPGCALRRATMNAAPCELCGRVNLVKAPKSREKMHPLARWIRWMLSPLGWPTHALTGVFFALAVWQMTLRWITEAFGAGILGLLFLGLLLFFIHFIRLGTRGAVWLFVPATRQTKRIGGRSFLIMPACVALLWLLNRFDVPLRVTFWASHPGWEQAAAGVPVKGFCPYVISGTTVDKRTRSVRFTVTNDDFFSGGTSAGFAKCPQGCGAAKFPPVYVSENYPARYTRLSNDWYWWEQSGSDNN